MTREEVERLLQLPAKERWEIAQILWQSIQPEEEARLLAIPDWQRKILDERLTDLAENPTDEEPWDKVRAEIWPA